MRIILVWPDQIRPGMVIAQGFSRKKVTAVIDQGDTFYFLLDPPYVNGMPNQMTWFLMNGQVPVEAP